MVHTEAEEQMGSATEPYLQREEDVEMRLEPRQEGREEPDYEGAGELHNGADAEELRPEGQAEELRQETEQEEPC